MFACVRYMELLYQLKYFMFNDVFDINLIYIYTNKRYKYFNNFFLLQICEIYFGLQSTGVLISP